MKRLQAFFNRSPFFIKLLNWEYWNDKIVYAPLVPYFMYMQLRSRSFFFFENSNPARSLAEPKSNIYKLIPEQYYPKTVVVKGPQSFSGIWKAIEQKEIVFPMIAKPDIGERGIGVTVIHSAEELRQYNEHIKVDYLIQEKIPYPNEVGIFYVRLPHEPVGKITGIVRKEFLSVEGDGVSTILQLLYEDPRHILQIEELKVQLKDRLHEIPSNGEKVILVPIGNHARGSKFLDISDQITPELTQTFDRISKEIKDFYFGRYDILYDNWDDLVAGRNFKIIESNGHGSEPTHIFDPKHSIFFAWKEIIRHWELLYQVCRQQNQKGVPYISWVKGVQKMFEYKAYIRRLDQNIAAFYMRRS